MSGDSRRDRRPPVSSGASHDANDADGGGEQDRTRMLAMRRRLQQRRDGAGAEAEGQQLNPAMRQKAEQSLGAGLGGVRVHQGPEAEQANAELGSKAFAVGSDVVLGSGVENSANQIMAHEVAHTVQQQGVRMASPRSSSETLQGQRTSAMQIRRPIE